MLRSANCTSVSRGACYSDTSEQDSWAMAPKRSVVCVFSVLSLSFVCVQIQTHKDRPQPLTWQLRHNNAGAGQQINTSELYIQYCLTSWCRVFLQYASRGRKINRQSLHHFTHTHGKSCLRCWIAGGHLSQKLWALGRGSRVPPPLSSGRIKYPDRLCRTNRCLLQIWHSLACNLSTLSQQKPHDLTLHSFLVQLPHQTHSQMHLCLSLFS